MLTHDLSHTVLSWSPDGALFCAATGDLQAAEYHIDVLHINRRCLLARLPLPFPAARMDWSGDSAHLVVGDSTSSCVLLMDFA